MPANAEIRADVVITPATGKRFVFDVRTVNALCASALSGYGSAATHLASIEREKRKKYAAYYANFKPVVMTLTGAVSDATHQALCAVIRNAASVCDGVLDGASLSLSHCEAVCARRIHWLGF